jgi:replicative DNA helicase
MTRTRAEIPPHNADIEHTVLGAALLESAAVMPLLAERLRPEDLFLENNRQIYRVMLARHARGVVVDRVAVADELLRLGTYDEVGGIAKLAQLEEIGTIPAKVGDHLDTILEYSSKRAALQLARRLEYQALNGSSAEDLATIIGEAFRSMQPRRPVEPAGPAAVEVHALLDRTYPDEPAVVGDGVITRRSIGILGGGPKLGKSALVMNLALCASVGQPWLGFPTERARTLIVNAEVQERELRTRMKVMLQDFTPSLPHDAIYFVTDRGLRIDRGDGLQTLRRLIEETTPDLLVLDPLSRFHDLDENTTRDMGMIIAALGQLVDAYGLAILLVHHIAKPSTGDPRQGGFRLRGSSALFGAADTVMMLDRTDDGFRLGLELRNGREREPLLLARTNHLWFTPSGPPEDLVAVANVVTLNRLTYTLFVAALKADQDISRATAERLLKRTAKAGLIRKDSDGLYFSTLSHPHDDGEGSVSAR